MPSFIIHVTLWQNPNFCSKNQVLNNPIFGGKIQIQCLKITQNVAFEFWHFPPIFVLLKVTCLVTLFDRKLQLFKNSPKWTLFGTFKQLLSTQNVNIAWLAMLNETFFCDFQTLCYISFRHEWNNLTTLEPKCQPKQTIVFHKTHKCSSTTIQNILLRFAYKKSTQPRLTLQR